MFACEVPGCGRKFDLAEKLQQHMTRKHKRNIQIPLRLPSLNKRIIVHDKPPCIEKTNQQMSINHVTAQPIRHLKKLKSQDNFRTFDRSKIQLKPIQKNEKSKIQTEETKIGSQQNVFLRISDSFLPNARNLQKNLQLVVLKRCQIETISLQGMQYLRQIDLSQNKLQQISFLQYKQNRLLKAAILDDNLVSQLNAKTKLKLISLMNNKVESLKTVRFFLGLNPQLKQINLIFNRVRRKINYQQQILLSHANLLILDEKKINKIDRQVAQKYAQLFERRPQTCSIQNSSRVSFSQRFKKKVQAIKQESIKKQLIKNLDLDTLIFQLQKKQEQTKVQIEEIRQENQVIKGELMMVRNSNLEALLIQNQQLTQHIQGLKAQVQFLQQCRFAQQWQDIRI